MNCHSSAWLILTMFSRLYLPIPICSGNASSILRVAQSYGGPYRSQATTKATRFSERISTFTLLPFTTVAFTPNSVQSLAP
jgi:hypothetical protein